ANINIGNVTGTLIEKNIIGANATNFSDPGPNARTLSRNINVSNGDSGTISNNLIGFNQGHSIALLNGAVGWTVQGNEIRSSGINTASLDGIGVEGSTSGQMTFVDNLIADGW